MERIPPLKTLAQNDDTPLLRYRSAATTWASRQVVGPTEKIYSKSRVPTLELWYVEENIDVHQAAL